MFKQLLHARFLPQPSRCRACAELPLSTGRLTRPDGWQSPLTTPRLPPHDPGRDDEPRTHAPSRRLQLKGAVPAGDRLDAACAGAHTLGRADERGERAVAHVTLAPCGAVSARLGAPVSRRASRRPLGAGWTANGTGRRAHHSPHARGQRAGRWRGWRSTGQRLFDCSKRHKCHYTLQNRTYTSSNNEISRVSVMNLERYTERASYRSGTDDRRELLVNALHPLPPPHASNRFRAALRHCFTQPCTVSYGGPLCCFRPFHVDRPHSIAPHAARQRVGALIGWLCGRGW